jgi:hypothetical protein
MNAQAARRPRRARAACAVLACITLGAVAPARAQHSDTLVILATRPVHPGIATLVQEMSIGVSAGDDHYMFGAVGDVAVGKDGAVFVYDPQAHAVRKYDAAGTYVRSFGRLGEGPGEFRVVSGIAVQPDGRLLVWDTVLWRITVFSAAGEILATWSTASGSANSRYVMGGVRLMQVDTAGRIYLQKREPFGSREYVVRLRPNGTVLDTLEQPPFPRAQRILEASGGGAHHSTELPFDAQPLWRVSPLGYSVSSLPSRYAVELLIPAVTQAGRASVWWPGQPIVSIRRDVPAEPVSGRERDSAKADVVKSMVRLDPSWRWSGPEIPATKALFTDFSIGMDGRIWVPIIPEVSPRIGSSPGGNPGGLGGGSANSPQTGRATQPARPSQPARAALYDVFEPAGVYLGQVQVPPRTTLAVRQGDYVWAIAYNADDVASVKRFKIAWK